MLKEKNGFLLKGDFVYVSTLRGLLGVHLENEQIILTHHIPSTCGTNTGIDCVGCGAFPGREAKESWGMPSGHAQTTAFAATYWTIYVIKKYNKDKKDGKKASKGQMYGSIAAMWLLAIAVWIQRIYSKCHSLSQVIIGALIGVGLGFLGYYASSKIFSQLPN